MAIRITSDGVISVPKWNEFIGTDVVSVFKKLGSSCHCKVINDSIGIKGFRHLTLENTLWRIEILSESEESEDVLSKRIIPSEANWQVIDIFVYHKRKDKPDFPYN